MCYFEIILRLGDDDFHIEPQLSRESSKLKSVGGNEEIIIFGFMKLIRRCTFCTTFGNTASEFLHSSMDFSLISNNRISITVVTVPRRRVIEYTSRLPILSRQGDLVAGRLFTRVLCEREYLRMRYSSFFFLFAERYTLRMAKGLGKSRHVSLGRTTSSGDVESTNCRNGVGGAQPCSIEKLSPGSSGSVQRICKRRHRRRSLYSVFS